jgi:hypothetical protein
MDVSVPTRATDSSSASAHRPHKSASDSLQLPSLLYSDTQMRSKQDASQELFGVI